MAEMDTSSGGGKKRHGKKRGKKLSTRVDLTPMVDLAFLLITFFMLTTTFAKPQTMEINMPAKDKEKPKETQAIKESKALTVVLGANDKVFYYQGVTDPKVDSTDFSDNGIRRVLLQKNREIPDLVVVIKPMEISRYKNVVDILDEMTITNTTRYAIVDITKKDLELVRKQ